MSAVTVTADKVNDAMLVGYNLATESQPINADDPTGPEEYRGVLRVTTQQEFGSITAVSQPTPELGSRNSLNVRFNEDNFVNILPIVGDGGTLLFPFILINQQLTPYESKGSTFFSLTEEWLSVSDWDDLTWV